MSVAGKLYEKAQLKWLLRKEYTSIPLRTLFRTRWNIDVGLYSYGCFDRWRVPGPIRIGRYCSFAKNVRVIDANHPPDALTTHPVLYARHLGVTDTDLIQAEPLIVEDDVWLGHSAIILPGCKFIGRGAIIGAGAIVTRNVERYAIVAGMPAKTLRQRFPQETAELIEQTRWWEKDLAGMRELVRSNRDLVYQPTPERLQAYLDD